MPRKPIGEIEQEVKEKVGELVQRQVDDKLAEDNNRPGMPVKGVGKVPWTMKEIEKVFPVVEYVPDETMPVTWNGVKIQCFAGVSQLMPSCFRDVMENRKRKMRRVNENVRNLGITIQSGALGPPSY